MMNQRHGRLTQDILHAIAAADPDDTPRLADDRLLAAVHGRQPLTVPERRLLARSAATRDRLGWLRHRERARSLAAWQARGLDSQPLQLLAAADETPAVGPLQLVGEHYRVALIPADLEGRVWRIEVEIDSELREATPGGFQLVDSEGLVWLAGHPDRDADYELVGFWQRDESLWQRVHRVRLELKPQ